MLTYREENRAVQGVTALLLGPFFGLMYVVSMPFITIATVVVLMSRQLLGGTLGTLRNLVTFGWRPSEAYLSGRRRKKRGS